MVSAVATYESTEQLCVRLVPWCVVAIDGRRFNLRFPDTRRLPAIFEPLTKPQRLAFVGNAIDWHFVGRDGQWHCLLKEAAPGAIEPAKHAQLDEQQCTILVNDSESDEIWVQLLDRGVQSDLLPSRRHAVLSMALHIAHRAAVDRITKLRWCTSYLATSAANDTEMLQITFHRWLQQQTKNENEV